MTKCLDCGVRRDERQRASCDDPDARNRVPYTEKFNRNWPAECVLEASGELAGFRGLGLVELIRVRYLRVVVLREKADFMEHPS